MSDKRKRTHCKVCKKRVNLRYEKKGKNVRFICPKCLAQGELRIIRKI
jgi:predicted RNA-binding Zn-ribbon protein involved in translation (DUF1610 family)